MKPSLVAAAAAYLALSLGSAAEPMNLGIPKRLYSTDQLPVDPICALTATYCGTPPTNSQGKDLVAIDASLATLRLPDGSTGFFYSFANGLALYSGTATQPFRTLQWAETSRSQFPYSVPVDIRARVPTDHVYISNVYHPSNLSSDPLIGFVHYEDLASCGTVGAPTPCSSYHIGIAGSLDMGKTWYYLGHVLNTYRNGGYGDASQNTNIGGVPYIVNNGWFYVYYMEYTRGGPPYTSYVSVARALVSDVVQAARYSLKSPVWTKYNNGSWNQDGLTGLGSPVLPAPYAALNIHADAAYSTYTKRYYLLAADPAMYSAKPAVLRMFSSSDGVKWGAPDVVAIGKNLYPTIVGDGWSDEDFHSVGRGFSLLYPQLSPRETDPSYLKCASDASHYACQDIYLTHVTLGGKSVSPILEDAGR